jgi:hypothetical protein
MPFHDSKDCADASEWVERVGDGDRDGKVRETDSGEGTGCVGRLCLGNKGLYLGFRKSASLCADELCYVLYLDTVTVTCNNI